MGEWRREKLKSRTLERIQFFIEKCRNIHNVDDIKMHVEFSLIPFLKFLALTMHACQACTLVYVHP